MKTNPKLQSVILLIDPKSPSFCYYENDPSRYDDNAFMSPLVLERAMGFAVENSLSINVIIGEREIPPELKKVLSATEHVRISSLNESSDPNNGVIYGDKHQIDRLLQGGRLYKTNLLLRWSRAELPTLASSIATLRGVFKRLNVILLDVDFYSEVDFEVYMNELEMLRKLLLAWILEGDSIELSVLTDRIFLKEPNGCEAGIKHVTIAPTGKAYICPGFFYDYPDESVGNVFEGVSIPNNHLLGIDHSPVCKACDAFHCKRCVYLNKKSTGEVNTPPREICLLVHLEREASRLLKDSLEPQVKNTAHFSPIPPLQYRDPFELVSSRIREIQIDNSPAATRRGNWANPERMSDRELLIKIYEQLMELGAIVESGKNG